MRLWVEWSWKGLLTSQGSRNSFLLFSSLHHFWTVQNRQPSVNQEMHPLTRQICQHHVLDFHPPELWEINVCLFVCLITQFMVIEAWQAKTTARGLKISIEIPEEIYSRRRIKFGNKPVSNSAKQLELIPSVLWKRNEFLIDKDKIIFKLYTFLHIIMIQ